MAKKIVIFTLVFYLARYLLFAVSPATGEKAVFLDVGQGDSAYIKTNLGKGIIIDGGPSYDSDFLFEKFSPYPFCNYALIVVSHKHADHTIGLDRLSKRCNPDILTFNDIYNAFKSDRRTAYINKGKIQINMADRSFNVDGVQFYILWPNDLTTRSTKDENDNSLVLMAVINGKTILLTGDASKGVLDRLDFEPYSRLMVSGVDIYKVSHHGSKTGMSDSFLSKIRPKDCIISVGKNSFGHPASEVTDKLTKSSCRIWRTDLSGNIEFTFGAR